MASSDPRADKQLPDIDDRLVEPETRYEVWDGELVYVSPADPRRGELRLQLCALIAAHMGPEFQAAAHLLTRTSRIDDIAVDISVYPAAPDPVTGSRQLAHLAFEVVVSKQSLHHAGRKAAKLAKRGVRRVFAIDTKRSRALEWSAEDGTWCELDPTTDLVDRTLAVPLPIASMIDEARPDDVIARALLAKRNPVLMQGHADEAARDRAEGKAEAVIVLLAARGIAVDRATRTRILVERDAPQLDRWIVRAAKCRAAAQLFAAN